jgi:hypothetical protein
MADRSPVTLQQGIWIDSARLAAAGLKDSLEVTVLPGEIRIRSAASCPSEGPDAAGEVEAAYPLIDESFREDWDAPGMEDYDRYDEIRGRSR